jgi:DNA polymerase-1
VLAEMELAGIKVDRDTLSRLSNNFAQSMAGLEAEIHQLAGGPFNVGSPKQLGEILFDKMSLEGGKKGKTGAWGTGADVLETLAAEGHDLPARVLDWRQLSKLKSTYTDALQTHINAETGRVHTSFSLAASGSIPRFRWRRPRPGGWPRPIRTCRTSRSGPRKAARSAQPSSPSRAT